MHVMLSPQTISANIRDALDVLDLSANCYGDGNHTRQASSESVPGMPPCKKLFATQRPVMVNLGRSPPVCVSDIHTVCHW